MAGIRRPGIDDQPARDSVLFHDEEAADARANTVAPNQKSTAVQDLEEGDHSLPVVPENRVPVRSDVTAVVDVLSQQVVVLHDPRVRVQDHVCRFSGHELVDLLRTKRPPGETEVLLVVRDHGQRILDIVDIVGPQ